MITRLGQIVRKGLYLAVLGCVLALAPVMVFAAPYAAMVIDARTGDVLHARNADTQLHPASLTKMMTLYIAFEAIEHGEISLDTVVTISSNAASEPPSKLGLKPGQKIKLRYLIRAAAVKSANDAATAIGEAISGSEAAFAARMNRTAAALGMTRSHFLNANGLTRNGHMSTARDMTTLGRHLFYDYPAYYNLFSRRTADAGLREVSNTNTRFLNAYQGADGIKTGYTSAAGFNLVASAERGGVRIITTVFGGQSTSSRNAKVAELMDLGFRRAPNRVAVRPPAMPAYAGASGAAQPVRQAAAVSLTQSPRPVPRPLTGELPSPDFLATVAESVSDALADVTLAAEAAEPVQDDPDRAPPRPSTIFLAAASPGAPAPETPAPEIVTRLSTSGGHHWAIAIGRYATSYEAERVLLQTALAELATLGEALRKVIPRGGRFEADFVGLTQEGAELACRRLAARNMDCTVIGPS